MKIVIVGSSHAGICAGLRALEEYPEAEITLYDKRNQVSFVSQGIISYLAGQKSVLNQSSYSSVEELKEAGLNMQMETVIEEIDTNHKKVFYRRSNSKKTKVTDYDKLILATGSYPAMTSVPFDKKSNLYFLKSMEDAIKAEEFLATAKNIAVIGGGMTGVEVARITQDRGIQTTLIHRNKNLLNDYLDEPASRLLESWMNAEGTRLLLNTEVTEISVDGENTVVQTTNGQKIAVDGVIFTIGFRPNSYLLNQQVELGDRGAVVVDEYMQTSCPDVFAVGDVSTTYVNLLEENRYLPHASDAVRDGEIAAINLLEARQKITSTQGTYHVPMKNLVMAMTGITMKQAVGFGYDADAVHLLNEHLEGRLPSNIWMIYERRTHQILGLQCIGKTSDMAEYVNIFSLAIQQQLRIEDIEFTDFYFEHGYKDPRGFNRILARLVRENER
ncbi:NAD(P)/FAD-dependent oxidoreductase [Lactococcus cremoris]|uniref:NAD(P)/FAD-dependent oxidoreductase n=1 Tax=Lactococcus lactis subsp. cremoris TaxID=1359 RepID=UPI0003AB6AF5|nr:FAD/NAD(P)-binding oxidoreductase [Lactococcus cremoris]AGV74126.1 NADH dehydrogenase [Lactococcus cremoris subsp. cremoris KW2]